MSTNSVSSFPVVGVVDPRINASASYNQSYVAHKGASLVTKKVFTTTSYSDSSFQFSTPPPNNKIFIDRLIWLKVNFRLTFDQDIRPGLGVNYGLRQFPIGAIQQTTTCTINTNQTSVVTSDILHALLRYSVNHKRQNLVNSLSASMPDQFQDFKTWADPLVGGSARNPLAAYGEQYYQNRGAVQPDSVGDDGKSIVYTLMEPIWLLSPMLFETEDHLGLTNVSTMDWNFNLVTNLGARMWCSDGLAGVPITSCIGTILSSPELHFNYLTPPELMFIPNNISYPYYNIIRYANPPIVLTAGSSTTTTPTNNIQLTEIPKKIYIYVQRNNSDKLSSSGFLYTDTFASISNITVTFNNLSSMFANYQQEDLYVLCRKNGLLDSYQQFKTFTGSVIALDPSYDFGLPSILAGGSLGQFNFQVTLTFKNTGTTTVSYVPYIVVVNEGIMDVGTNGTIIQTGVLGRAAVLNSNNLPQVDYDFVRNRGGSIFGKLKSFLQSASPYINKIARVGEVLGKELTNVGVPWGKYVEQGSTLARNLTGGKKNMYRRRGKGLYGAGLEQHDDYEV